MQLKSVHVQNFRSVEDSGKFSVESSTCLVGKNEAGKTAVLQAIAGLNPHPATPFAYEVERDYPKRFLARYRERHPDRDAVIATTEWELTSETKLEVEAEFGPESLTGDIVTVLRIYNSSHSQWVLPINEERVLSFLISNSNFSAPEKSQLGTPTTTQALVAKLNELAPSNKKHKALLDQISAYPNTSVFSRVRKICEPAFPQFMYFSNYDRMSAVVHLPTLKQKADDQTLFTNSDVRDIRLFWEFLEYSGVSLDEILGATTFESFNARLQAASNVLTDEILEYWTQNQDIEVRVNVTEGKSDDPPPFNSGAVGRARIYNMLHKADTSFSERSAGFTWFFSFLIKFDRVKKEADGPIFLLLDEPGLTLHGTAQGDLLRFFSEKLSPHHQIMYSTHSPFMVPHENLATSRIVEDLVKIDDRSRRIPTGTKVREDVLSVDRDSVFPLQGALGYAITQTLFIGKHTILVEGPSDILYMKALSAELLRRGRTGLDPQWVICPSGGLDKIQAFVSLFAGNDLDVIALSDFSRKDRNKLEALRRSQVLKSGGLLTIADFVDQDEADIEDLIDPALFCTIVNTAYELPEDHALDTTKLSAANENTERQVKKAEAFFNVLPNKRPVFDHFLPASWLISNPSTLNGEKTAVTSTLDRAEKLFEALNSLKGDID
jgi:predicted ATP-dependent endonuclease of OLD family